MGVPGRLALLRQTFERWLRDDPDATQELIRLAYEDLHRLARQLLGGYPGVHRWLETTDFLHTVLLERLLTRLGRREVHSLEHFFALSRQCLRCGAIDLLRHYYGPHGAGSHHASDPTGVDEEGRDLPAYEVALSTHDPAKLIEWTEFLQKIDQLPGEQKEVLELLVYQELTVKEAAEHLGVCEKTVRRYMFRALASLPEWPGER